MAKRKRTGKDEVSAGAEHTMNDDDVIEEKPTAQTMFYLTPTQKKKMVARAKSKGLTTAAYIKSVIAADGGFI